MPHSAGRKLQKSNKQNRAIISGLETTLTVISGVTANLGIPGLQAGISSLRFILKVAKETSQNREDLAQLENHVNSLMNILQNASAGQTLSSAAIARIETFSETCNTSAEAVQKMADRSFFKRIFKSHVDSLSMSDHMRTITLSIERFMVETNIAIEVKVDGVGKKVEVMDNKIEVKVDGVGQKVEVVDNKIDQLHEKLTSQDSDAHLLHAISAVFDYKDRPPCLEGTRAAILNEIYSWIAIGGLQRGGVTASPGNSAATSTLKEQHIFWINGSAGTGKTTIAYTVADACRRQKVLGASFFCSRDDADCTNPKLIFPTIAYQLGQFCVAFRAELARALASNRDIGYSSVPYQLEELIIKPLRVVGKAFPRSVVVLDALDECKDDDSAASTTSTILSALSRHVTELSQLKILITSRPENRITTAFQSVDLKPATQRLVLHEVQLDVVQVDIKHYLTSELASICEANCLGKAWPSKPDIHRLADMSYGLFIFAATSIRFINDRNYSDPRGQLESLLHTTTIVPEESSPHHHLDQLYTQVLTHAFPKISHSLVARLGKILGSIVLLQDPLSPLALAMLLKLQPTAVRQTLLHLHSVIIVPENDSLAIRLLHPSFFDFITNPTRCPDPNFLVNVQEQHTMIACACLETMKALKHDICDIKDPTFLNSEIHDLPTRIATHIPSHLQYACRHWATHLASSTISDSLLILMKEFTTKYLLYWVEVCSLLGDLRNALLSLNTAKRALSNLIQEIADTIRLLHDCEHFTREFFAVISISSLQASHSALLFTPRHTLFYKMYSTELLFPAKLYNAVGGTWNSCLRIMEGHSQPVRSVAFSPDGTQVASGSYDETIRLWDAVSGALLNTLNDHVQSEVAQSVAFSPDGMRLASGSCNHVPIIRLWDTASGALLGKFKGHSNWITSVAFSPDGALLVSGSEDQTVRLWDAVGGAHLSTFTGHSHIVHSVAFSPNGMRIASGSQDETIRLWDTVSGAHLSTFKGHSYLVCSVAFSPNGMCIASGSGDKTIRLWDAVSGAHLSTLSGHYDWVMSVAFSPDGAHLASGSEDHTIRLWDAVSGACLNTFNGHSSAVKCVAFSPNGMCIASGSGDTTIRLWDAVGGAHLSTSTRRVKKVTFVAFCTRLASWFGDETIRLGDAVSDAHLSTFKDHSSWVSSVAFSPDSMRLASGSGDKTIRLWDAVDGGHLSTFHGHSAGVRCVAFSPDGMRLASGSGDKTIRLWDAVSGSHLSTLSGHSDCVESVAFSPDGMRLASGSADKTIQLWDAGSGAHLTTCNSPCASHSGSVESVAFSPDGARLVSGSDDKTIQLWDAVSGFWLSPPSRRKLRDTGHFGRYFGRVYSVAFSADGACVVSGTGEDTIKVWNIVNRTILKLECLDEFSGHRQSAPSVASSLNSLQPHALLPQGNPSTSTASVTHRIPCYILRDGWIYALNWKRRVFWIPVSCRPTVRGLAVSGDGNRIALGTGNGLVVILGLTGMDTYLESLGLSVYTSMP